MVSVKRTPCINTGCPTVPTLASTIGINTLSSRPLSSFKCIDTRCVTTITLHNMVSRQTWLQQRGELLPRPTFWKGFGIPGKPTDSTNKEIEKYSCMLQHYSYAKPIEMSKGNSPWPRHQHQFIYIFLRQRSLHS